MTSPRALVLVLLTALSAAVLPVAVSGQGAPPELERGEPIRVFSTGIPEPLVGHFVEWDENSLLVQPRSGDEAAMRIYLDRVERLERRVAGEGSGFLRGALIGAGATVAGGFLLMAVPSGEGANMAVAGGIVLAPLGALAGGLIGLAFPPERWEPVPVQ